ncbi:DUF4190 domain-containing protein [Kribbella sp. CA-293567]|uniref:DUF4190 domain-containing protein n=1 Tax=Kribbella sp. CA-293567 TaxID=3002436 RepID=UPI0022DD1872|nr:DUF4190 domain-containing protein [Kribbella sp. CA-293567]WBQ04882.1 DUF4190 domain-containing protein [Kribbella sp. CA-293567]
MSYPPGSDPNRPQDVPRDPAPGLPTYGRPPESASSYEPQFGQQVPQYGQPPQQLPPYPQQQAPYGQPQQPQYGQTQYGQPQYGQPQYPAAYGYGYGYPGHQQTKTNGLAIAALICALGGLVIGLSAPVGVALGIAALAQIKKSGESGKGQAIAGIVIGGLLTLFGVALLTILIIIGANSDDYQGSGDRSGQTTYVDSLAVGECYDDAWEEDEVHRRSCATPHDGELISNVTLPATPYPGERPLEDLARNRCDIEFGKYVGTTVQKSELQSDYWVPSEDNWDHGDRLVICAVYGPDDDALTGTVKDSKR